MVFKIRALFGSEKNSEEKSEGKDVVAEQAIAEVPKQKIEPVKSEAQPTKAPSRALSSRAPVVVEQEKENKEEEEEAPQVVVEDLSAPEDDNDDDEKSVPRKERFKPKNIEELLLFAVPDRANGATSNLKAILSKKVLIDLMPSGRKYLFDPTNENGVTVKESGVVEAECTLQLHEKDLMKISDGNLNPQVLLLSHKAKVSGDAQVATHFFTLIAPPSYL